MSPLNGPVDPYAATARLHWPGAASAWNDRQMLASKVTFERAFTVSVKEWLELQLSRQVISISASDVLVIDA